MTIDQALTVARNLAGRKAGAFARRCRLPIEDREDVESHLMLNFVTRWPKFDRERASVQTFASRLMDRELISILRYRSAKRRQVRDCPVTVRSPAESRHHFRIDFERAMAPLPDIVRKTASVLSGCSAVEAAAELGCSRQMISRRKQQIREALLEAGVTPDYFAPGGTCQ